MKTILLFAFSLIAVSAHCQKADSLKYCLTSDQVGIGGHDPVSYIKSNKSILGAGAISTRHDGVEYRFVSLENKKEFLKSPSKYLPQFGGWCSMTLAMGRATTPKYDNFLVKDGKLWLFERTLAVNGKELWLTDPKGNSALAKTTYKKHMASGSAVK
jgi:YHS domain-containing protein